MKKKILLSVAGLLAAGGVVVFGVLTQGSPEFQVYEQRLSSGDVDAAARRLSELKDQYDKDMARIDELDVLKEVHIEKAKKFVARCDDLPSEDDTKSMVFAQRLLMMEMHALRAEYLELSYNTLSTIEAAKRNWKRHSLSVTDSYNQLIYYTKLHSEKKGLPPDSRAKWAEIEDAAWSMQAQHEMLLKRGTEQMLLMQQLQTKFQKSTEARIGKVFEKMMWWKIEPLFSFTALRYIKIGIKDSGLFDPYSYVVFGKNAFATAGEILKYLASTAPFQVFALVIGVFFFILLAAIARYLDGFEKKWPNNKEKAIILFERFLKKRSLSISVIIYIFIVSKLTLFPYPDVHLVMVSLWFLLPIWCVLGAVDVILPCRDEKAILGILTHKARCRARFTFMAILWTQMIGWEFILLSRTYSLGYPYGEAMVSAAMNLMVLVALWAGILRGLDNAFAVHSPKTEQVVKNVVGLFAAFFGILTLLEIIGYVNIAIWVSYNLWATAAVLAAGYLMLASATVVLAQKWFPELMEFRRNGVSRFAFLGLSSSGLYDKHLASDLRMLIVHAVDFVLTVATGLFMAMMMAWVWDFKWDWIWKLGALPCMPYMKGNIPTVGDVATSFLILYVAYWLSRNIKTILTRVLFEPIKYPPSHQYTTILLITYLLWTVGAVAALGNLDLSWSKIQWLVAAMGVGVGFGLQEIVSNFISGLILLFERPIKVNDYISLDKINGVVEEIQIRSTTIRTFNNVSVIVPNKDLITKQIVNQTYNDDVIRLNVPVGVSYGSDVDLVERILLKIAASNKNVLEKPGPTVILKEFGDNSINFLLRAYIDNARCDLTIQSDLNKEIKKRFEEAGITIPFPQRDVHIIGEDKKNQGTKPA